VAVGMGSIAPESLKAPQLPSYKSPTVRNEALASEYLIWILMGNQGRVP
jgi:hypothetical protein